MVLTVLCFMLNPPWCMGSRLNNSTLSPIPGKVKSSPYIIESFRTATPDAVSPCPAGSGQEVSGKDGVFPCISGISRLFFLKRCGIIKL